MFPRGQSLGESIDSSVLFLGHSWLGSSRANCWRNASGPCGRSSRWKQKVAALRKKSAGSERGEAGRSRPARNICQSQSQEDRSGTGKVDLTAVREAIPLRRTNGGARVAGAGILDLSPENRFRPPITADEWNINNQFRKTNIAKISFLRPSCFAPSSIVYSMAWLKGLRPTTYSLTLFLMLTYRTGAS